MPKIYDKSKMIPIDEEAMKKQFRLIDEENRRREIAEAAQKAIYEEKAARLAKRMEKEEEDKKRKLQLEVEKMGSEQFLEKITSDLSIGFMPEWDLASNDTTSFIKDVLTKPLSEEKLIAMTHELDNKSKIAKLISLTKTDTSTSSTCNNNFTHFIRHLLEHTKFKKDLTKREVKIFELIKDRLGIFNLVTLDDVMDHMDQLDKRNLGLEHKAIELDKQVSELEDKIKTIGINEGYDFNTLREANGIIESNKNFINRMNTRLNEKKSKIRFIRSKLVECQNEVRKLSPLVEEKLLSHNSLRELIVIVCELNRSVHRYQVLLKTTRENRVMLNKMISTLEHTLEKEKDKVTIAERKISEIESNQIIKSEKKYKKFKDMNDDLTNLKKSNKDLFDTKKLFFGMPVCPNLQVQINKITNCKLDLDNIHGLETLLKQNKLKKTTENTLIRLLSKLCRRFGGKSIIWLRNYLSDKYYNDRESKINKSRSVISKFYYTYVNIFNNPEKTSFRDFALNNTTQRKENFSKYYRRLDGELHTRTSLYKTDSDKEAKNYKRFLIELNIRSEKQIPINIVKSNKVIDDDDDDIYIRDTNFEPNYGWHS